MNALGLAMILKSGCFCIRETVSVNGVKYIIKEQHLGEGGFSTIDLIENPTTKKKYVLKKIICHSKEDQEVAAQEILYYKKFRHPNIIELIDSTFKGSADMFVAPDSTLEAHLVLPYYRRGTLHDHLALKSFDKSYMNEKEVLRIFYEICLAVKCLHDGAPEPIAHRDLKTANVCLSETMSPILMDFGSCAPAKVQICGPQDAQRLQDLAAERCSMTYRAPELFYVENYCVVDQRTDIWSLGCLLYALCYFKSPYDIVYERGDSVNLAVISGNLSFPEESPFSNDVHELILFMLKISPSERPFIDQVIERTVDLKNKLDTIV